MVPIEEDVEIISNCDMMEIAGIDCNDMNYIPNQSLVTCTSLETAENKISPTDKSHIVGGSCNMSSSPLKTKDINSHHIRPNKKRRLLYITVTIYRYVCVTI